MNSAKHRKDTQNDSLLEDPNIKQFITTSRGTPIKRLSNKNPQYSSKSSKKITYKCLTPHIPQNLLVVRKKISLESPSKSRISFFTKIDQSRKIAASSQGLRNSSIKMTSTAIKFKQKLNENRSKTSTQMLSCKKTLLSEYQTLKAKQHLQNLKSGGRYRSPQKMRNSNIKRNLSSSALRSKSEVEQMMAWKRRNYLQDPFKESLRESDYLPIKEFQ